VWQQERHTARQLSHTSSPKNNENVSDKARKHGEVTLLIIPNINTESTRQRTNITTGFTRPITISLGCYHDHEIEMKETGNFHARHVGYDIIKHFNAICRHFILNFYRKRWKTCILRKELLDHKLLMTTDVTTIASDFYLTLQKCV